MDIQLEYAVGEGVKEGTVKLATIHNVIPMMDTRGMQGYAVKKLAPIARPRKGQEDRK